MPRSIRSRASTENLTSLADMSMSFQTLIYHPARRPRRQERAFAWSGGHFLGRRRIEHAHDVALLHDQEFDPVNLDFGARPFAEQNTVADHDIDRDELPGFVAATRPHCDNLTL